MAQSRTATQQPALPQPAKEILAGELGQAARRWLGPVCLIAFGLFLIDTYLVINHLPLPVDEPIERAVQGFNWGPLAWVMTLTNASSGVGQYALGAIAVVALLVWDRRAGFLLALGTVASVLDSVLKISIQRHRPTADLVKILDPSQGYSYPSGHAVFFTWLCFMLAAAISPRVRPRWRLGVWGVAAAVIFLACTGRVWGGAHWPSDVVGGFLLGLTWSAFVLWLPERWLPSPSRRWLPWYRIRQKA